MKGLNGELATVRDGAVVRVVRLSQHDGAKYHVGVVTVYWPFIVFRCDGRSFNLTHAPMGYNVDYFARKSDAINIAKSLRAATDWMFWSTRSRKFTNATKVARALLPRFKAVA